MITLQYILAGACFLIYAGFAVFFFFKQGYDYSRAFIPLDLIVLFLGYRVFFPQQEVFNEPNEESKFSSVKQAVSIFWISFVALAALVFWLKWQRL